MFQFTENQVSIPHYIVHVKKYSLLIKFVLEAVLVLFAVHQSHCVHENALLMYTAERQNWQMHGLK